MATDTRCPEWMLFYLRAQAQGAFGAPADRDRSRGSGERCARPPGRNQVRARR